MYLGSGTRSDRSWEIGSRRPDIIYCFYIHVDWMVQAREEFQLVIFSMMRGG
jgi:hypothetical protein